MCIRDRFFSYYPGSQSPVSSDPTRACLCDDDGQPQCADINKIYVSIKVYPGETITLPAVVIGADLGTTIGTVHAIHENLRGSVTLKHTSQYAQFINNSKMCSKLNYAIFSQNRYEVLYLTVKDESLTTVQNDFNAQGNDHDIWIYHQYGYVTQVLLDTPPLINVTLLPCPPGFTLLGDPPGCDCNPCLLYTSPSPRDATLSRMPSSA